MKKIITALVLLMPFTAFSHGDVLELTEGSVSAAIELFEAEPDEVRDNYSYLKSWASGAKIKVKIYYGEDGAGITYECEMQHTDGSEEIVCTK